jgi:hypothetical protein
MMSDYGRYEDDTRNRGREEGRDRNRESIFAGFRDHDHDRDNRSERMGGWAGSGRTSAYDPDGARSGNWTSERENFSLRDGRERNRDRERHGRATGGVGGMGDRLRERGDGRRRYGRDDDRAGLPIDETSRLIASNKVEGTAVYGRDDRRLGSIYNFMVEKYSGRVEYAVMSYGGMLGMGTRYYPLPWQTLTYDTERGGYRIELSERDLRDAPSFDRSTEPEFDRDYGERVHSWYGLNY